MQPQFVPQQVAYQQPSPQVMQPQLAPQSVQYQPLQQQNQHQLNQNSHLSPVLPQATQITYAQQQPPMQQLQVPDQYQQANPNSNNGGRRRQRRNRPKFNNQQIAVNSQYHSPIATPYTLQPASYASPNSQPLFYYSPLLIANSTCPVPTSTPIINQQQPQMISSPQAQPHFHQLNQQSLNPVVKEDEALTKSVFFQYQPLLIHNDINSCSIASRKHHTREGKNVELPLENSQLVEVEDELSPFKAEG